jgi:hypothetical protein
MTDVYEHNPRDHEDPLPGPTWTVLITGCALLAVVVLGVTSVYWGVRDLEFDTKVAQETINESSPELVEYRVAQLARLDGSARRELRLENPEGEESLVIPLEDAMGLLLREAAESQ